MKYFDSRVFTQGSGWPIGHADAGRMSIRKNAALLLRYIRHMSDISDIRIDAHCQKSTHGHP